MTEEHPADRAPTPACRWRTAAETLDVIEALDRIEAVLTSVDQRVRRLEAELALLAAAPAGGRPSEPLDVNAGA